MIHIKNTTFDVREKRYTTNLTKHETNTSIRKSNDSTRQDTLLCFPDGTSP